ncbi:MAG: hypothetical protein SGJ13_07265, partial [Actinomycetota bacterium]|nr:hypothetical protein [Actinomycetota bacterium]
MDVVTGALSSTGRYLTERLVAQRGTVRTLTYHPDRPNPFGADLEMARYRFDDPVALAKSLEGARTLYNTYWVRFAHGVVRFDDAVANSRLLFDAARRAGVERALGECGVPFAIVRPTVVFGREDILLNNIDLAALCAALGERRDDVVVDAVGPETYTFNELVDLLRDTVGSSSKIIHAPAWIVATLARGLSVAVRDVLLTREELDGMMAGLVSVDGPTTAPTSLREWVGAHRDTLGENMRPSSLVTTRDLVRYPPGYRFCRTRRPNAVSALVDCCDPRGVRCRVHGAWRRRGG